MSDIAVVEVDQKPVEKKVEIPKAQPEEKSGKWVRTRFCCCPPTARRTVDTILLRRRVGQPVPGSSVLVVPKVDGYGVLRVSPYRT